MRREPVGTGGLRTFPAEAVQQFRKQLNKDREAKKGIIWGGWGRVVGSFSPCCKTTSVFLSSAWMAAQTCLED